MPCPLAQIDKLDDPSATANQQVRRHLGAANLIKKRMLVPIQAVGKQALNTVSAILSRWQGDVVNNQQLRFKPFRAGAKIR